MAAFKEELEIKPTVEQEAEDAPFVDGSLTFVKGVVAPFNGRIAGVTSPIRRGRDGERITIGTVAHMRTHEGAAAVEAAHEAFGKGQGAWPTAAARDRFRAVELYMEELEEVREEIVKVLQWEICKTTADATKEFDRTMDFVKEVLKKASSSECFLFHDWTTIDGVRGKVRRGPVGVVLMVAPFNYPLNEMYAMMLPALLMGNTIVLKLPTIGGLAHVLTIPALRKAFPPGVVNFVTGTGRSTLPPIMESGKIDMIGFIGGTRAMDALIKDHPEPHRLKVFSQLEGNNMAIILRSADLDVAVKEVLAGTTSYNGQRCTAVKVVLIHSSIADDFVEKFTTELEKLPIGLPWTENVKITPLPDDDKPAYLSALVEDAVEKGARVVSGGTKAYTLVTPTLLYPVTPEARVFHEEQFGPVIPVAPFDDVDFVLQQAATSWSGQQAAIFGDSQDDDDVPKLVDGLQAILGRININTAPSRGPDLFPFSGRRSSAMGTMSVTHAIDAFSVETVIAFKDSLQNQAVADRLDNDTNFLKPTLSSPP